MSKSLNQLTKEEIAQLFPVVLTPYDTRWPELFELDKCIILETLENTALRIEHFGSTAIPGLTAKDTIDLLIEIPEDESLHADIIEKMKPLGYEFMWQTDANPPYMVFAKGYNTAKKEQTYHIHMSPGNHSLWDRLYFRDYLRENRDYATAYETLKIELAKQYELDRVGYRVAKTEFVTRITAQAKAYYTT